MRGCRPLSEVEIERVLDAFDGATERRDRALFLLGVRSGFRIAELLSVRVRDIFDETGLVDRVTVARRFMKHGAEGRTVLLHPAANWIDTPRISQNSLLPPSMGTIQSRKSGDCPLQCWMRFPKLWRPLRN